MMDIHKILTGDNAEQYLPFALSKVRWLLDTFNFPITQKYETDSVSIKLSTDPISGQHFIRIDAGGPFYEFFTPESIEGFPPLIPGSVTTLALTPSVQSADKVIPKGFSSEVFMMPGVKNPFDNTVISRCIKMYNKQRMPEYIHWVSDTEKGWTSSTYIGENTSHNWLANVGYIQMQPNQSSFGERDDYGLDLQPAYYAPGAACYNKTPIAFKDSDPTDAPDTTPVYGRACIQVVTDPTYGKRAFFVMTDSFNDFYVYPVNSIDTDIVPTDQLRKKYSNIAKKLTPVFPGWVATATAGTAYAPLSCAYFYVSGPVLDLFINPPDGRGKIYNKYRYKWAFNSTGTKAVAIVGATPVNKGAGVEYYIEVGASMLVSGTPIPGRPTAPSTVDFTGVVEIGVNITLTGDKPENFDAHLTVESATDSRNTNNYYVAADYAFDDKRLKDKGINKDQLVTAYVTVRQDDNVAGGDIIVSGGVTDELMGLTNARITLNLGLVGESPALRILCRQGDINKSIIGPLTVYESDLITPPATYGASVNVGVAKFVTGVFVPYTDLQKSFYGAQVGTLNLRSLSVLLSPQRITSDAQYFDKGSCSVCYGEVDYCDSWWDAALFLNVPDVIGQFPINVSGKNSEMFKGLLAELGLTSGGFKLLVDGFIAAHPSGNIAYYLYPFYGHRYIVNDAGIGTSYGDQPTVLDAVIRVKKGKDGVITDTAHYTHRDLFNKAFKQSRPYSWYSSDGPGKEGGFCTMGVWSTTAVTYAIPSDWVKSAT